jgi:N-acetylmuramic acid 6-phosphate etherase
MITEQRNPDTYDLDTLQTPEIVMAINRADQSVALAVASATLQIAAVVDAVASRLSRGGRLFYVGSGTSGRLGVLDAVECPPTFGVPSTLVQGVIAGGKKACHSAVETAEDSPEQGETDLQGCAVTERDAVVGLAASGQTPYTLGAVRYARRIGALTVGISCNRDSVLSQEVDLAIEVETGPEVLAGSTRMKAGTAQKMILNIISTATMVKLGYVYSNLMVNVRLKNQKLLERGASILKEIAGVPLEVARTALEDAGDVRTALLMLRLGYSREQARAKLKSASNLRELIG